MKKISLLFLFVFAVSSAIMAGAWRNYEDYKSYLDARKTAKAAEAEGDTATAVSNYLKAAEYCEKSATKNYQAWQINNAAFVLITKFKTAVGYAEKLAKLESMKPSPEKVAYQKELANLFGLQLPLIEEAARYLEKAAGLGDELEAAGAIKSNSEFCAWVKDFVNSNTESAESSAGKQE